MARKRREQRQAHRRDRGFRRDWASASALREFAWEALRVAVPVLLPFVTLVGGGAWSYRLLGFPTWVALGFAIVLTAACLTGFGLRLARSLNRRFRLRRIGVRVAVRIAVVVVTIYTGFMMLYLARENAKTDAVRSYFTSVHPLLRIAIGTVILVDPTLVVTDTRRLAADYARNALPPRERSLHFSQRDGYVHAVDLRTNGRSWLRNALTRAYFSLMGFQTLRHVGTADHLHVSLPLND